VELDGHDHVWFAGDTDRALDEIESFVTGAPAATPTNRVLSTVLSTDIVGSAENAEALGDEAWTAALDVHNNVVEERVASARGEVIKFTGDGALATFDGPAPAINCARDPRRRARPRTQHPRRPAYRRRGDDRPRRAWDRGPFCCAIMALAGPGEVLVSGAIPPLVLGSRIEFDDRGCHEVKGVRDPWPVLAVRDARN
jgi:class 3 adenylate cyclase